MKRLIAYCTIQFLLLFVSVKVAAQEEYDDYKRLTNLPHVIINTYNNQSITSKVDYIYSTMYYVDENDVVTKYDSMQIRGRGNSTWGLSKKPYRIKFHEKEKFLGKGYAKAKSWTLLANATDHSLIRNCITSVMGDFLGLKNSPACRFVDLTLNGTYLGNYQISDQVEVRPHRVAIMEQDYPLTDESNITGGYLLEVDGFKDGNYFTTSKYSVSITVHYPDEDEISASQNQYIRNYIKEFENALSSSKFTDPETGYRQYVDSMSLANWYIASEVSGNIDAFWSTYFYKEQDDPKLYFGPLWDYDIAYANDNRKGDTSGQLMTDVGYGDTQNWINRMWEDPWFGSLINRTYNEAVDAGLLEHLHARIDSAVNVINESQQLNFQRWGISKRVLREYILYSSYDQYITYLKKYLNVHIPYLQKAFASKEKPAPVEEFVADPNYYYRFKIASHMKSMSGTYGTYPCIWDTDATDQAQQWEVVPVGDYYMIVNRRNKMALNDPTQGACTTTTNTGTKLDLAEQNADDDRQLWSIIALPENGTFNLANKNSQHVANLYAGYSANGSYFISYNNDARNSVSLNRQWYITKDAKIEVEDEEEEEPEPDAIASVEPAEYALAFNPQSKVLHFGSETPELLIFNVHVYSASGALLRTFRADEQCSVADLPSGVYVIRWVTGGRQRSTKLKM